MPHRKLESRTSGAVGRVLKQNIIVVSMHDKNHTDAVYNNEVQDRRRWWRRNRRRLKLP